LLAGAGDHGPGTAFETPVCSGAAVALILEVLHLELRTTRAGRVRLSCRMLLAFRAADTPATGRRSSFAFYSGTLKIFLEWGILGGILILAAKLSIVIQWLDCARSVATLSATDVD
jgi:hypothetical protein